MPLDILPTETVLTDILLLVVFQFQKAVCRDTTRVHLARNGDGFGPVQNVTRPLDVFADDQVVLFADTFAPRRYVDLGCKQKSCSAWEIFGESNLAKNTRD